MQPYNFVENKSFRYLLYSLNPSFKIPWSKHYKTLLNNLYEKKRNELTKELQEN